MIQGNGILFREPDMNPPKVRKILQQIGNEPITSLKLIREPLSTATRVALSAVTFGQLKDKMKETNIDKLFHLSLYINDKYRLDKRAVIELVREKVNVEKMERLDIPLNGKEITINEMMENTRKQMGKSYAPYDGENNNCSVFVSNVLSSNGLLTDDAIDFLSQKTPELFSKFPSLSRYLIKFTTDLGAILDRQLYGEGELQIYNFGLQRSQIKV